MKKKTYREFVADIKKKTEFNPAIVFWHGIVYQMYRRERLQYDYALKLIFDMAGYNGF